MLEPLDMRHSSFAWREDYAADAATGHDIDGKPARKWQPMQAMACASLHTTALDYARFIAMVLASDAEMVTQIIPIRFVDAAQLVSDLSVFVSQQATIMANTAGNSIIITDTQANILHLMKIIKAVDDSAEMETIVKTF